MKKKLLIQLEGSQYLNDLKMKSEYTILIGYLFSLKGQCDSYSHSVLKITLKLKQCFP